MEEKLAQGAQGRNDRFPDRRSVNPLALGYFTNGPKLSAQLKRSADWVNKKKAKLKGTGVSLTSA
jgi:hypothetical protein